MATVLDTSALVVLMRRSRPPELEPVADAARGELEAGRALLSAVTVAELLVGSREGPRLGPLLDLLIGATAVWLDVPLLTCDSEFRRGIEAGDASRLGAWSKLRLHAASP